MMKAYVRYAGILLRAMLFLFALPSLYAIEPGRLTWSERPPGIKIIDSDDQGMTLSLDISYVRLIPVHTARGVFIQLAHRDFTPDYRDGYPQLPVIRKIIENPAFSKVVIDSVGFEKKIFHLDALGYTNPLFPNQPSVSKNSNPPQKDFYYNEKAYGQDRLLTDSLVSVSKAGILRGRELTYLTISPFSYNPARNILEVKDHIVLHLRYEDGDRQKTVDRHKSLSSPAFDKTFSKILNYTPEKSKTGSAAGPLKMVILTDSIFRNSLDEFIRWKESKGIEVTVAYKGNPDVGTTVSEMKAYLTNLYNSATPDNPAPSYLLIIGDVAQIPPSSTAGHVTDLYYATYDGNGDYIPDIYYGRFSANDSLELAAILEKHLEYEQYLFPDPSFLDEAVMIAGVDGAYASVWGNGQINYGTNYYYNSEHGIQSHTYLYPESGNSDAQIIQDISNGVGFVNYTGHGYSDRWEDPRFSIYDIDNLQNAHQYPLMIGNGCVTATFGLPECFAEALVRTPGKGALSYIGCSNDSYWDEDYYWAVGVGPIVANPTYEETGLGMYDRLFHDHGEPEEEWYINQSQMIFAGNMAVMTGVPSRAKYYWEIYQLLGDPSLMVYLNKPDTLLIKVAKEVPQGTTNLTVITEAHTQVTLSRDTIIASIFSNADGVAFLNFPALQDTGYINIVATHQNRQPYIDSIHVINNSDAYIALDSVIVDDTQGNGNGQADFGEPVLTTLRIHNLGLSDATQVSAHLSIYAGPAILVDSTLSPITLLRAQTDTVLTGVFRLQVHDSIEDGDNIICSILFSDARDSSWTSYFIIPLHAPKLQLGSLSVNDSEKGNGNRRIEPGESLKLNLNVSNSGTAASDSIYIIVSIPDTLVTQYDDSLVFAKLTSLSDTTISVSVTIDPGVAYGTPLPVDITLTSGAFILTGSYTIPIGLTYDDFELGNFTAIPWEQDTLHPWVVTSDFPGEGLYTARSAVISNSQKSDLFVHLQTFQDDTIRFMARVSSEKDYDFLHFLIDGVEQDKWSGELSWSQFSFPVTEGTHTLTWRYSKDGSVSHGYDAAWIDYVVFPMFSFSSVDAGVIEILSPKTGSGLTGQEPLSIRIKNFGNEVISQIPVGFSVNDQPEAYDTLFTSLTPGDTATFTFSQTLDLSVIRDYDVKVFTRLPGDQVHLNDTLAVTISHSGVIDLALDAILAPVPDSFYVSTEPVVVRLINLSSGPVNGIPITFRINNETPVSETASTTMNTGDTLEYTFVTRADLSDTGRIVLTLYCDHPEDAVRSNDTLQIILYNLNTSTGPARETGSLKIWPNPAKDILNIQLARPGTNGTRLLLVDETSRIIQIVRLDPVNHQNIYHLSVQNLKPGIYFVVLQTPEGRITAPVIKSGRNP